MCKARPQTEAGMHERSSYVGVRSLRNKCSQTSESIVQSISEKYRSLPGIRTWNCAGPGAASKLLPEAPEGCVLR
eukprot:14871500-Alexandrium_andersonii.AAC.1